MMASVAILTKDGKEKGKVDLPKEIFTGKVNDKVIHQAVVMYQASLRQGTLNTKERADVSGGGKKPYRQKGTGRARQGSSRSPLWKGGGTTFGPHPRDFGYSVPKKIRKAALRESLNAKFKDEEIIFVEELTEKYEKTKDFAKVLKTWNPKGKTLALIDGSDQSVLLAGRNIPGFRILRAEDANAYDLMKYKTVILTKKAFDKILERLK